VVANADLSRRSTGSSGAVAAFGVQAEQLTKSYGEVTALAGLDLGVPRHSLFGFLGPNDAGKTTAMRLLLGLSRPTSGRATVLGHDVVRESLRSGDGWATCHGKRVPPAS
jgi:ABC-type multidrug transport system ATPase subunit